MWRWWLRSLLRRHLRWLEQQAQRQYDPDLSAEMDAAIVLYEHLGGKHDYA